MPSPEMILSRKMVYTRATEMLARSAPDISAGEENIVDKQFFDDIRYLVFFQDPDHLQKTKWNSPDAFNPHDGLFCRKSSGPI
jgi:hypothetical protein